MNAPLHPDRIKANELERFAQEHEGLASQYLRSGNQWGGQLGDAYRQTSEAHQNLVVQLREKRKIFDEAARSEGG